MRRVGLIAAGVVLVVLLAGVGAWLALFRDTAEPVTVADAVTSFRTDTESTPSDVSPIPPGVYVYATNGYEKTDALIGITHRYPRRTTITVAAAPCGMTLTWRVLEGRSTTWTVCAGDDGWELRTQDERHTFFGRTETTTYDCGRTSIRPARPSVGSSWVVSCATSGAHESGRVLVVRRARLAVAGVAAEAWDVRKSTTFRGSIRGSAVYDFWFPTRPGVPLRIRMISRTTNDSPVGDVHYEEVATLRLLSLRPRR